MNLGMKNISSSGGRTDRRGTNRFPLQEEVTYKVLDAREVKITGTGKTLNIGSGGILFSTEERLPLGWTVELSVRWPARLGGPCPLKFVAVGRIVRSDLEKAVVRIERYEFKARRTTSLSASA